MIQGAISPLPGYQRVNYVIKRRLVSGVLLDEAAFEEKVVQCRRHLQAYRDSRAGDDPPELALEVGTGMYPVIPVCLWLAGVARVVTVDVAPLLNVGGARSVLEQCAGAIKSGRLHALLPDIVPERAKAVIAAEAGEYATRDVAEMLAPLGVQVAVGDARASGIPTGTVDLLVSNNTLEHIPPKALCELMTEFRRVAKPGAVMDHFVDMSDHYAHFDHSITEFNYMRYSDRVWRIFNNRLHYQNRLRRPDYRRIIEQAGFDVIAEETQLGEPEDLAGIALADRFRRYPSEDLRALRNWITATPRSVDQDDARDRSSSEQRRLRQVVDEPPMPQLEDQ
jgi:hypothetical protein